MAELGSLTELAHFRIGEHVARLPIDVLVTVGPRATQIADGARAAGMAAERDSRVRDGRRGRARCSTTCCSPGDAVLVKASRVMGLERSSKGS